MTSNTAESERCCFGTVLWAHEGYRHDKWEEAVYVYIHPASVRYHSYCVYSPCVEVSDNDSSLYMYVDTSCNIYGYSMYTCVPGLYSVNKLLC